MTYKVDEKKFEVRISKSETKFQYQMKEIQNDTYGFYSRAKTYLPESLEIKNLNFAYCFKFRISCFGFFVDSS